MPKRLVAALNYNENKVSQQKAECLYAGNFLKGAHEMNFYQKMKGFERLNILNERAHTKTLHVSLNFDPSEKLSCDTLINIAERYMDQIGFGEQPFLIYNHQDAGHPHVHIVTTTIRDDGSRINTHNIGRNQSEKARKEIEKKFGLVRAENQKQLLKRKIQPVKAEKIIYGKTESKKAIANVVNAVLNTYRYSSLPELNAVLRQYNVTADRGKEEGRIYRHRGLVYRVLDDNGNKIGVPIKASLINSQPTLNNLEKIFLTNAGKRDPFKGSLKKVIDEALAQKPGSLNEFTQWLQQKNVFTLLRQNTEGRIYGITFVDNQNKIVFNGSQLGKQYSVARLQQQIISAAEEKPLAGITSVRTKDDGNQNETISLLKGREASSDINETSVRNSPLLDKLISPKKLQEFGPYKLLKKKRRKKKKI